MKRVRESRLRINLLVFVICLLGFLIRVYFVPRYVAESGDLRLYADWGEKFWDYGTKNFYYVDKWYYSAPNYPPIISLIYGAAYWLYDHKYVLAQIHNATRLVPAFFIRYFYKYGYLLLLKLPGILADIGVSLFIYRIVSKLSKNDKKGLLAMLFYIFNPVSVFLSGIWGQTDSLVAFLGLLSFMAILDKRVYLSLPLFFTSIYIKPNWIYLAPLFLFVLFVKKVKIKHLAIGGIISFIIFYITTAPFAKDNVFSFVTWLISQRILPTATAVHKASVSAFNFYTIFWKIDYNYDFLKIFGISLYTLGVLMFTVINLYTFKYIKERKGETESIIFGIFTIGVGSYLLLTNMLERYFFSGFIPMLIIMATQPKLVFYGLLINFTVFLNLIYAFFRRSVGKIADLFTDGNFLLIRLISLATTFSYFIILYKQNILTILRRDNI